MKSRHPRGAAVLCLVAIAFTGCGKSQCGGDGVLIARLMEFKDQMCACTNKACVDHVKAERAAWVDENTKDGMTIDPKKVVQLERETTACMARIVVTAHPDLYDQCPKCVADLVAARFERRGCR